MGFTTGFTGGVTLTLGLAYLTVLAHERSRRAQCFDLRAQSRVLNGLLEPAAPLPPPQTRAELAREERSTIFEAAKDRWNAEVENAIRWVQRTDWSGVREELEDGAARLIGGGLEKSRNGIDEAGKNISPKVQQAVDRSKAGVWQAADEAREGINRTAVATVAGSGRIVAQAQEAAGRASTKATEAKDTGVAKASRTAADAGTKAQQVGGTIDAAGGALRDVVHKGVEAGKDLIGKAQAVTNLTKERIESRGQSSALSHSSAVERALRERYTQPAPLKSMEEALEERYKPVDSQDMTAL